MEKTLYEINEEYLGILAQIEDNEGELTVRGDGVAKCRLPCNSNRICHDAMEQRHVVDGRLVIFA